MKYIAWICSVLLVSATTVVAGPKVSEQINHYTIKGDSAIGLRAQMSTKGPQGYWGYSEWWVEWDASCNVSVTVTITMPKLSANSGASDELKADFQRMYDNLLIHERQHGQHGISAAEDILAAGCRNTDPIFAKWNKADRDFDLRTDHGRNEGVVLR
ncbi:MAG: DUF922 domain-containing protein [Pseudomonadota bacterium]